jgi:hypothetical protein
MKRISTRLLVIVGLALAIGLATAVSPYASSSPDGLEKVAEDKGFIETGKLHSVQEESPIPDYAFPGIDNSRVATGLAGFVGTLGVFAIGFGLARVVRRPPQPDVASGAPA